MYHFNVKFLTSFKIKLTFKDQGFPKLRSIIDYISKGNDTDQIQKIVLDYMLMIYV